MGQSPTALLGLAGVLQWGLWRLADPAAVGAGADVLAEGQTPTAAQALTLQALKPPPGSAVQVQARTTGTEGTVTLVFHWPTPIGVWPVTAERSVALLPPCRVHRAS